jgi:hypothetical protein
MHEAGKRADLSTLDACPFVALQLSHLTAIVAHLPQHEWPKLAALLRSDDRLLAQPDKPKTRTNNPTTARTH